MLSGRSTLCSTAHAYARVHATLAREELMGLQLEWREDKRACEAVAHAGTLGRHSGRT